MSGNGAPDLEPVDGAQALRVVVLAARWHGTVMDGLLDGAKRALAASAVRDVTVLRFAGAFELPVAAARVAHASVDAIIALGVIIRGDTPHFDYVCNAATNGLTDVMARTGVPIGFGVLTCDNEQQAMDRAGLPHSAEDKGYEVTQAALSTAVTLAPYHKLPQRP